MFIHVRHLKKKQQPHHCRDSRIIGIRHSVYMCRSGLRAAATCESVCGEWNQTWPSIVFTCLVTIIFAFSMFFFFFHIYMAVHDWHRAIRNMSAILSMAEHTYNTTAWARLHTNARHGCRRTKNEHHTDIILPTYATSTTWYCHTTHRRCLQVLK